MVISTRTNAHEHQASRMRLLPGPGTLVKNQRNQEATNSQGRFAEALPVYLADEFGDLEACRGDDRGSDAGRRDGNGQPR